MLDTRQLTDYGIGGSDFAHVDLRPAALVEHALRREEAALTDVGALRATTGQYTGRSPSDKFIVRDDASEGLGIAWGRVNQPIAPEFASRLQAKVATYLGSRPHFVFHGFAGTDPTHRLPIRVVTEYAWHSLFVRQLFVRPTEQEREAQVPAFTVLCAPGVRADPDADGTRSGTFIVADFRRGLVTIGGTEYAGEMKKAIFTVLNALLPGRGVLPMHCSANVGDAGDVALFFGLSGTGKTTLSADPGRHLIGDDEHGWSDQGVFNFEGGCYAKCIGLTRDAEPQIWDAIRFGSVLENVVIDPRTHAADYASAALTENTRAAYPVDFIPGAVPSGRAGHPRTILFLTADASGVLPPISRLSEEAAMYHFLAGYTSKLAGTERGVTEPQATFSTGFGEPFLPLDPMVYARMLGERIRGHAASVYLVNTGWTGGPYGEGRRMPLRHTRAMVRAAISGALRDVPYRRHPVFRLDVPEGCPGVPAGVLDPRSTWSDGSRYDAAARTLARQFVENAARFPNLSAEMIAAGPQTD